MLKYKEKIYIENAYADPRSPLNIDDLAEGYAGICLDFTHLEDNRLNLNGVYQKNLQYLANFKIGCAHIGPIKDKPSYDAVYDVWEQESHKFTNIFNKLFQPSLHFEVKPLPRWQTGRFARNYRLFPWKVS